MEFNLSWALYESLVNEIETLQVNNYNQYTLTVIIENDINGLAVNCGLKIYSTHSNPILNPITIVLDLAGQIVDDQIN